ncbi:MAG TPA: type II toxin-antitoxin system HicA family toxin [Sedimentisphaerales bacterium]|nr:type II toxin-antitoxin system HicA family toxin [Sedimentisphaerales bacterium]
MSAKFPIDAPKRKVVKALEQLGFRIVRQQQHISMLRENSDGSKTPLTMPNHPKIKASTLRTICTQSGITKNDFLQAYKKA